MIWASPIAAVQARLGAAVEVDALAVSGGSPARRLHELADDRSCVAVALGSSRHAAQGSLAAGLVSTRVLEGSRVPVAVAPRGYGPHDGPDVDTIGVGYFDSMEGREASTMRQTRPGCARTSAVITVFDHVGLPEAALGADRDALRARSRRALDAAIGGIAAPRLRLAADPASSGSWLDMDGRGWMTWWHGLMLRRARCARIRSDYGFSAATARRADR